MTEGYQQEAQHALSSGNIIKCIDLLKANVEDRDLRQQVLQAEIRYNSLRRRINAGTISSDDAYLEENKISNSLLFIISNLATHQVAPASASQSPVSSPAGGDMGGGIWKWALLAVLGVGLLGLLAVWFFRSGAAADDPCAAIRCANGGNCIDGTCYCPDGFTGPRCEQPVDDGQQTTGQGTETNNTGTTGGSTGTAAAAANLVIEHFKQSPSPPVQREPVQVSFAVRNTGGRAARNFTVEYWAGENFPEPTFTKTYSSLSAGATQSVSFRYRGYTSWYGRLRNKIVVDSKDRVQESDEQDNIYQTTFSVTRSSSTGGSGSQTAPALPDLKISAFQMKPNPPVKGQKVYMQAIIRNTGNGDAGGFNFQYFPGENYPKPAFEQRFSGLRAGAQQVLSFQYDGYPSHYGSIRNKLVVDPDNRIRESSESNNVYQEKFSVRSN